MSDCQFRDLCTFFIGYIPKKSATPDLDKKTYCQGAPMACARYYVMCSLGPEIIPLDMHPNQLAKARALVASGGYFPSRSLPGIKDIDG